VHNFVKILPTIISKSTAYDCSQLNVISERKFMMFTQDSEKNLIAEYFPQKTTIDIATIIARHLRNDHNSIK